MSNNGMTEDDARRFFAQASGLDAPIEILSMATWMAGHALVAGEARALLDGLRPRFAPVEPAREQKSRRQQQRPPTRHGIRH